MITLKVPITTAEDDIHKYSFIVFQRIKDLKFHMTEQVISCESWIHMTDQVKFTSTDKSMENKSVACCNFAWRLKLKSVKTVPIISSRIDCYTAPF